MNIFALLALFLLFIAPASAWENKNGIITMNESELIHLIEGMRGAGMAQANGMLVESSYSARYVNYSIYKNTIKSSNDVIKNYNTVLKLLFNTTTATKMKLEEFELAPSNEGVKTSFATDFPTDRTVYSQMENEVEALLKSPNYTISDPQVSIGPSCVIINYDNNGILQVSLDRDLNYVIDQYVAIVKRFPEITGPLMIERSGGAFGQNEFFEYRCKREWVDSTNTTDINSIDDLRLEVRLTEKTKPMTEAETRRYIG